MRQESVENLTWRPSDFGSKCSSSWSLSVSAGDISRIVFVSGGSFESFKICYPSHMVNPACNYPLEHWLYWGDLSFLTYVIEGVLAKVILWVSWSGRDQIAQSPYALKLRATKIGYVPPLVVYGSFEPLLGKAYLLHSGAHISSPWFACILAVDFLRSVLCVH